MPIPIPVTLLYGSLTLLLVGALGANTSRVRVAQKVFIGDPAQGQLQRVIRAHGNAAEWAPPLLLCLLLLELAGAGSLVLHLCGGTVFGSRLLHAVGVYRKSGATTIAAGLTYLLIAAMPIYGLVLRFSR